VARDVTDISNPGPAPAGDKPRVARVLVIDDEIRIASALRRLLSDEFETAATTRPDEALEWLTSDAWYDVILCDVMMPTMNGVELRNRVHAVRPDLAARIIFVTGGIVLAHLHELLDTMPNMVLEKPLDFGALKELIRRRVRGEPLAQVGGTASP
jgi:DNA-binding NtrC family response regulator